MRNFEVTILEVTSVYKSKVFQAKSEAEARRMAEEEDWRDESWEDTGAGTADCAIEEIDEVE